jgi:hypothetical protein
MIWNQTAALDCHRCVDNSYGDDQERPAVASASCTACPPSMYTADHWGAAAPANGYTDQSACKVDSGWGMTESTAVEICQVGFYNSGQKHSPCTACPNGYTTLGTASNSSNDCVIHPGWYYDTSKGLPAPCVKGYWSSGGTAVLPEPSSCTACATGYTTHEQESGQSTDCAGECDKLTLMSACLYLAV